MRILADDMFKFPGGHLSYSLTLLGDSRIESMLPLLHNTLREHTQPHIEQWETIVREADSGNPDEPRVDAGDSRELYLCDIRLTLDLRLKLNMQQGAPGESPPAGTYDAVQRIIAAVIQRFAELAQQE